MTTENLNLPEMLESQGAKHITHNEALQMLDVFVAGKLKSKSVTTPPSDPSLGDAYFIPSGGIDDWSTNVGKIAHWNNGQWYYYPTPNLWLAYFEDEGLSYRFDGTDWNAQTVDVSEFGLGSTAKFITVTDYNNLDQLETGFYATFHSDTSTVSNKPAFKQATNVNAIIKVVKESDRFSVEVVETKRTDSRHFREKVSASTWGSWRDLWAEIAAAAGSGGGSELTAAEIKTLYESNADTNAFTDAEEAAIANLGASAFLESFKDYGLGIEAKILGNLTTDVETGFYKFRADYPGAPADNAASTLWYSGIIVKSAGGRVTYDFILVTGGTPRKYLGERIGTSGAPRWREISTEVTKIIETKDVSNIPDISGFYAIEATSGILNFPETSGNWQFLNLNRSSTGDGEIAYCALIAVNRDTGKMYTGSFNDARSEGDKFRWFKVYHSGNLDPDAIDKSTGKAYADMTSGNVTLDANQSNAPVIQLGGTPGASRTLTVAALERMWVVTNDSDGGCTLTTGSGGTVFLEAGYQYVVFGDGVGVRAAVTIAPNGLKMNGDLILPIYSTASLPDPSTRYMVTVGCTDGDSGSPCLAVSDGGSWKRIALGATVSAT